MAIVRSEDQSKTTAVIDTGAGLLAVWVNDEVDVVQRKLQEGVFVKGDSEIGEVRFTKDSVKYLQTGQREVNKAAGNRPT